jgi:hypothetical protein
MSIGKPGRTLVMLVTALSLLMAAPFVYASQSDDRGGRSYQSDDRGHDDATRWALVDENGKIIQQTGGFKTVNCFQANANCYIDIGADARDKGLGATIAGQNNVMGQAISLTGEIGVGACGSDALSCAPPGTEMASVIVVSPRNSDGSNPTPTARKRFYVQVLGSAGK